MYHDRATIVPTERDNEGSFRALYENAPRRAVRQAWVGKWGKGQEGGSEGRHTVGVERGGEIREIERNRRYIFTDDKLTANLFALPAASPRPIKYS